MLAAINHVQIPLAWVKPKSVKPSCKALTSTPLLSRSLQRSSAFVIYSYTTRSKHHHTPAVSTTSTFGIRAILRHPNFRQAARSSQPFCVRLPCLEGSGPQNIACELQVEEATQVPAILQPIPACSSFQCFLWVADQSPEEFGSRPIPAMWYLLDITQSLKTIGESSGHQNHR